MVEDTTLGGILFLRSVSAFDSFFTTWVRVRVWVALAGLRLGLLLVDDDEDDDNDDDNDNLDDDDALKCLFESPQIELEVEVDCEQTGGMI